MKFISTFTSTFTEESNFDKAGNMNSDFIFDKTKEPEENTVNNFLGIAGKFWDELRMFLTENIGKVSEEWKFYSAKSGWIMKVLLGKRNLFFMKPGDSTLLIAFVFGDKAVAEVIKSQLPDGIKTELSEAKKYVEGRGLQVHVKTADEIEIVKKLVEIKVKN